MSFDLGSFFGGVIGGLLTLIGVVITIKYFKKSDAIKENKLIFEKRPDLKIVSKKNKKTPDIEGLLVPIKGINSILDNWVTFKYNGDYYKDKDQFKFFDFYFENAGLTAITYIDLISNVKDQFMLFDFSYKKKIDMIRDGDPSYAISLDKRIDPGEVIKIRMFHLEKVWSLPFSAPLSFALTDTADRLYSQPFFYPTEKIYTSKLYRGGKKKHIIDIQVDDYIDEILKSNKRND